MDDEITIGARLRMLRRWRGMTLAQLAGQASLSISFLSMAERGQRALDRRSYIAALANALQVSEAELVGGPHLSNDPLQAEPHTVIPHIRAALLTNTLTAPAVDFARPLADLTADLVRMDRAESRYLEIGGLLPSVVNELHVHASKPADEQAHRLALESLISAFHIATDISMDLGHGDLAHIAAMRAAEVANLLDDPIGKGKAAAMRLYTMPVSSWRAKLTAAEQAVNDLEPHVRNDSGLPVLGILTLAASLSATVAHAPGQADTWIDEAKDLAARVPDTPAENWGSFSSTNVAVWRIAMSVERGESGPALLDLAEQVDEDRLADRPGRHAAFLADIGRGLARNRKTRPDAVRWLRRAEHVAPQKIRNDAKVRESVAVMLQQARTASVGRELRGIASRMGIAH